MARKNTKYTQRVSELLKSNGFTIPSGHVHVLDVSPPTNRKLNSRLLVDVRSWNDDRADVRFIGIGIDVERTIEYVGDDGIRKLNARIKRLIRNGREQVEDAIDDENRRISASEQVLTDIYALGLEFDESSICSFGTGALLLVNGHQLEISTPRGDDDPLMVDVKISGTTTKTHISTAVEIANLLPKGDVNDLTSEHF